MGSERVFAAINTKIRVLKAKLLDKEDYISLMEKETIEEQVLYLKENTSYKEALKDIEDLEDIKQIEIELERNLIHEFERIIKYFTGGYRDLFKALILRYEIEDLKLYLRAFGRDEGKIKTKINHLSLLSEKDYSFDPSELKNASNLEELVENLKGTIYYNSLSPYKKEDPQKIIFYMEMNLDRLYFNLLRNSSKNLNKEDRLIFEEILGRNEDLLNIEWIYRGLKFYNLIPEELINYTLPYGYELNYKNLRKMCYSNISGLEEMVLSTSYGFLFDTEKDVDLYMERRIQRYIYYRFLSAFKKAKFDITLPFAYFHLLEYEIRDIVSILEAKKYGLKKEEMKEYLVRKIEGSDK
ncbi:V-type ATPase subunit [Tissierella pigra]|uniref:V-type ATPase subunit n=1 Tax=Tissierella pigra TaxID=2607614 RepID=A0A6N7XY85_9FIRM|nr:V-type ATPase subunit [Tissierella pigra]MBU5428251.1 V-type ATPase subunit [Tissierella pigra]MSU02413.1 V-type ATPase subunit [Tissierella pigra]